MSFQSLKGVLTSRPYRGAVKRNLVLVALGLVSVLVAAGQLARAAAGPGTNDIQDSLPGWNADGTRVAFDRTASGLQHIVTMSSAGKDLFVASQAGVFRGFVPGTAAPPFMLVQMGSTTILTVGGRFAGAAAQIHGVDATASPDGKRLAYLRDGTLYVARLDSVKLNTIPIPVPAETPLATGVELPSWDVTGPVWSPDGTRIVVADSSSLLLVNTDGSGSRVLFRGANQSVNPSWSPDGSTIAFERNDTPHWQIWTVPVNGTQYDAKAWLSGQSNFRFPQFSPHSNTIAFISDKQHAKGGATPYQFALYVKPLDAGVAHKLVDDVHPYSPPRWSPTAALIAVSAGQECRRWGIYVGRSDVGSRFTRRSNACRFTGTTGADRIGGSQYFDIINGLAGDDTIRGLGGNDAIYGENGDDTIAGGSGNDFILGGPGNDTLYGGSGNDVLIGGNGHDVIDCGPGIDTVEGAGPLDHIARNCEHVRR
jgi:hemolysin type calcium-binding protein/WD40 repeat protein